MQFRFVGTNHFILLVAAMLLQEAYRTINLLPIIGDGMSLADCKEPHTTHCCMFQAPSHWITTDDDMIKVRHSWPYPATDIQ
jgi:hypothetical protein